MINRALPVHVAGGLERHVEDLAAGLAAAGVEVHLLTAPLPTPQAADERRRLADLGLAVHEVPEVSSARYSLAWMRGVAGKIAQLVREVQFDCVHAQEFAAGLWRPGPGDPPLVVTVHGTLTSETPLHRNVWPLLHWAQRPGAILRFGRRLAFVRIWRGGLEAARRILVDSAFTRDELARLFPILAPKVQLVPLGVPWATAAVPEHTAARQALGWIDTVPRLVTTGRLEWAKGQDLAIEALAGLRAMPWHYAIAGEGSWRGRLERQIAAAGLGDRITLIGRQGGEQLRMMLAGADLFLWPERTHPAFGLAGYEAHLAGTPVLATRRGAIPEVLGAGEGASPWIVDCPTAEAFRAQLRPLLENPARLDAARAGLREAALARFSYQTMIASTLAAYQGG